MTTAAQPRQDVHIDVAAAVDEAARVTPPSASRPPALTEVEHLMLAQARRCAAGEPAVPPRRELVAVALKEAAREQWWRDHAEAEAEARRVRIAELERQLQVLQSQRDRLVLVTADLVQFAARALDCLPVTAVVMERVRAERVAPRGEAL